MRYQRMPIEVESPEQVGYSTITNNLSESSVADRRLRELGLDLDLDELVLCYGDHLGDPVLRQAIAGLGPGIDPDDVLVTPGAAAALFCTATAMLNPGDHLVVVRTNYATNLETPRAIGADLDIVDLRYDDQWRLDIDELESRVRPGHTRMISVTCPHNPTGTMMSEADLHRLVGIAEASGAVLLVDETYRDLTHGPQLPMAATLSPRAISVASMSKAYGLPGIRIGWAVATDPAVKESLLAAKEQIVICGSTIDEHIAGRVLSDRERILPPILHDVQEARSGGASVDAGAGHLRVDRAEWRSGGPGPLPAGGRSGRGGLLLAAAHRPRHLRRAGPLVRARRSPLPARLRLAHP